MSAVLGYAGVMVGFAAAVLGVLTLAAGIRKRDAALLRLGRQWAWLVLVGAGTAAIAMEIALVRHDFSLRYVADHGSTRTPLLYTIASLWAALEGSIILWSLVLS